MVWNQPSRIRRFSAVAGCVLSLLTLVAALVIFTVPTLMPVGILGAAFLSSIVLSLPVCAMGLVYALYIRPPDVPPRLIRTMQISVLASLGFFFLGLLGTATRTPPSRTTGNAFYLIGIIFLLATSTAVLLVE